MGKCRFWLSYTSQRGTLKEAAPATGDGVHVRGWDAGAEIIARPRDRDEFDVYMTGGNHGERRPVHVGTVKDTPDGPVWEPAVKPVRTRKEIDQDIDRIAFGAVPIDQNKEG
jgi:hypothetical protein